MKTYLLKKIFNRLKQDESGAIAIIVALSMVVVLGFAALVIDSGSSYVTAGKLQTALDSAAYSAGKMLPVNTSDSTAINAIKDTAISYAALNGFDNITHNDIVLGNIVAGKYTSLKITHTEIRETTFAKLLGKETVDIPRSAKVILSPVSRAEGVAPLGIASTELATRLANNNYEHIILKYGKGGSSQGFFGALDLNGKGGGASDYRLWLSQGYGSQIVIGDILLTENGNMVGPTYEGFSTRFNGCTHNGITGCTSSNFVPTCPRVITVVVYSDRMGFSVVVTGFAQFLLEAQTDRGEITGTFLRSLNLKGKGSGNPAGSSGDFGSYALMLVE